MHWHTLRKRNALLCSLPPTLYNRVSCSLSCQFSDHREALAASSLSISIKLHWQHSFCGMQGFNQILNGSVLIEPDSFNLM